MTVEVFWETIILSGSRKQEPSVCNFKNMSENSASLSQNITQLDDDARGVQRKRLYVCRKLVRWLVLNSSKRADEEGRSAGRAVTRPRIILVSRRSRRANGEQMNPDTVVVEAGPRPCNEWRLGLRLRGVGHQCHDDIEKEPRRRTRQLTEVHVTAR